MLLDRKEHKNVIGSERAEILLSHPFAHAEDSRYLAIRSGAKPADHLYATKLLEDKQRDKKTAPQRTELIDDSLMKRARKYVGVVLKDLHSWSDGGEIFSLLLLLLSGCGCGAAPFSLATVIVSL